MNNSEFRELTSKILLDNPEWEAVYSRYADEIIRNRDKYGSNSRRFQVKSPLVVYSTIGKVKTDNSTTQYDLRFAGQSVGVVSVNKKGEVRLNVSDKQAEYARDKFGFVGCISIESADWSMSKEAVEFRKFFGSLSSSKDLQVNSQEHRIESFLLKEFSKKLRAEGKLLCNIQPVRLGEKFFQLTTPLEASKHMPKLAMTKNRTGANGGGIDILARVKHAATESRLAIMELKDENVQKESQEVVMHQAITYATFIAHLLRSESGRRWWNIFRPKDSKEMDVPEHIDLDVVTVMPEGDTKESEMNDIAIDGLNVTLHLYTLYYSTDKEGNPNGFTGTLKSAIVK